MHHYITATLDNGFDDIIEFFVLIRRKSTTGADRFSTARSHA